jgi:hypothetical protein
VRSPGQQGPAPAAALPPHEAPPPNCPTGAPGLSSNSSMEFAGTNPADRKVEKHAPNNHGAVRSRPLPSQSCRMRAEVEERSRPGCPAGVRRAGAPVVGSRRAGGTVDWPPTGLNQKCSYCVLCLSGSGRTVARPAARRLDDNDRSQTKHRTRPRITANSTDPTPHWCHAGPSLFFLTCLLQGTNS